MLITSNPVPADPSRLTQVVPAARDPRLPLARFVGLDQEPPGVDRDAGVLTDFTGAAGQTRWVGDQWLVGRGDGSADDWRAAGGALIRALAARDTEVAQVEAPSGFTDDQLRALVLGLVLGAHRLTFKTEPPHVVTRVELVGDSGLEPVIDEAMVFAAATATARDLANYPSDVKTPAWLAEHAAALVGPEIAVTVRDEKWLAEHGFGGILAVGSGSTRPPRLIEMSWRPEGAGRHLVLVGKGITFDTGGISVKPADGMHLMRTDMAGSAAVIAAMRGIAALGLPIRVTGLVPSAENHVSGSAYRPGDVVRHYGGTTTEVINTDAEGRMVLADALAYAVRTLEPDLMVNVATLTGAMKVSLGLRTGGLFSTDDDLARRLIEAGTAWGESWWRMPLVDDYESDVDSDIADVTQGRSGPGGVVAALFLRHFIGEVPWAHLDIAGPGRAEKAFREVNEGATGFAARTLIDLARSYTR